MDRAILTVPAPFLLRMRASNNGTGMRGYIFWNRSGQERIMDRDTGLSYSRQDEVTMTIYFNMDDVDNLLPIVQDIVGPREEDADLG